MYNSLINKIIFIYNYKLITNVRNFKLNSSFCIIPKYKNVQRFKIIIEEPNCIDVI